MNKFIKLTQIATGLSVLINIYDIVYVEDRNDYRLVRFKLGSNDNEVIHAKEPINEIYAVLNIDDLTKHLNS